MSTPTYHDLFITTEQIPRTCFFNLPFNLMVTCTRSGGWELWQIPDSGLKDAVSIAGEFSAKWLVLEVDGKLIVDSRKVTP